MTIQTANTTYVCGWTTDDDCGCDPLKTAFADNPVLAQRCLDTAAEILYALSGRQFGVCETTVRPCRKECCSPCGTGGPRWTPVLQGGEWTNVSCSSCGDGCSCTTVCEVRLPGPVDNITEVKSNGVVLPVSDYRVDGRSTLVRVREQNKTGPALPAIVEGVPFAVPYQEGARQPRFTFTLGSESTMTTDPDFTIVSIVATPEAPALVFGDDFIQTVPGQTAVVTVEFPDGTAEATGAAFGQVTTEDDAVTWIIGSNDCWPTCQDMAADADQPGTWEVTYGKGLPVPAAGRAALLELACEICKACLCDNTCRLPSRVTNIQRQGVSIAMLDPMTFIDMGKTGLYLVDLWLQAVNPKARSRGADADVARHARGAEDDMAVLDLFATAARLSDCVCEALKAAVHPSGRDWQGDCCVWPGAQVAFDNCCDGKSQAWVTVLSGVPTSRFPVADPSPMNCSGRTLAVVMEVGSLRCVGTPCNDCNPADACAVKEQDAADILLDLQAMLKGIACCFADGVDDDCEQWTLNSWRTIGPEGGCSGSVINITVEQSLPCC